MIDDDAIYRDAREYMRAHAIDGRSFSRAHLEHLVRNLQIPLTRVAELLGIPRWLMARKARRLGFFNRQHSQKAGGVLEPSQDRLRGTATVSIESHVIDRPAPQDNYHEAKRFIAANSINGISISREHLKHLLINLKVSLVLLSGMLHCHEPLLARKARRWRLGYRRQENQESERKVLPLTSEGKTNPPIGRQGNPKKYQLAYEKGKAYFAGLDQLRQKIPTAGDLHYFYNELALPLRKVAQLYGRSATDISNKMGTAGMERRTAAETRTSHYDVTFFREWSPAMAWVLGLIYTDGNLTRNCVTLSSIDRELLEKVRVLVAPRNMIYTRRQSRDRDKTIDTFQIAHQGMVADLRRIGLQERKSLIMKFPDVPPDCTRHFIRGCWDGDGGFTESVGRLSAHYTCGSRKFIEQLVFELLRTGLGRKRPGANDYKSIENLRRLRAKYRTGPYPLSLYKHLHANAYQITITSLHALEKLYDFFYKDVDPAIYLSRKHEIIKRYLSSIRKVRV